MTGLLCCFPRTYESFFIGVILDCCGFCLITFHSAIRQYGISMLRKHASIPCRVRFGLYDIFWGSFMQLLGFDSVPEVYWSVLEDKARSQEDQSYGNFQHLLTSIFQCPIFMIRLHQKRSEWQPLFRWWPLRLLTLVLEAQSGQLPFCMRLGCAAADDLGGHVQGFKGSGIANLEKGLCLRVYDKW